MILTKAQEDAIKIIIDRYKSGERYSVLSGYAGVGKTTCIKFIVEYLLNNGLKENDIAFCALAGKAVQVMIDKGNKNALTIHKLLYCSRPLPNGKFIHIPKTKAEMEYKVIICDEVSMVSQEMIDLMLSYPVYIIFCGDNFQLPAIDKNSANHLLDNPHAHLTEVMRQAQDSGIIRLSMAIREGKSIDGFKSDDAMVLPKRELNTGMLEWADQILCGTNATRKSINAQCRQLRGYNEPLEQGEKIIILRNDWDTLSDKGNALTNGCIGTLDNNFESFIVYPAMFKVPNNKLPLIIGEFKTETGDDFGRLAFDEQCLITGDPFLSSKQKYNIGRNNKYKDTLPLEATYGYCITTHKSQGSEWSKVLVMEERFPFDKEEHKRWLYTACTRASEKLVLIK